MNKTGNFSKVQRMVILAVLIALTLVMALTPLGYLKIGALSISFLCIPIAIGATVLGPTAGLISAHSLVSQALYNALVWTHSARQCFQSTGFTPL